MVDTEDSIYDALLRDNVDAGHRADRADHAGRYQDRGRRASIRFDVIVYATGFKAQRLPLADGGPRPRRRALEELWAKDGARAYIGTMLPGFPNFFMVYGPNTNPSSAASACIDMEEMAIRFALQCIEALIARRAAHGRRHGGRL